MSTVGNTFRRFLVHVRAIGKQNILGSFKERSTRFYIKYFMFMWILQEMFHKIKSQTPFNI